MNSYKSRRLAFLNKYFPYPKDLEEAIHAGKPDWFASELITRDALIDLHRIDEPQRLIRLLDRHGFEKLYHFNFSFAEKTINDFCGLYWDSKDGLSVHFEWLNIISTSEQDDCLGLDDDSDLELFFKERRQIILTQLGGGKFDELSPYEDIVLRLTDAKLRRFY